jgi:hypothetical protein
VYDCFSYLSDALAPLKDCCVSNKKEWSDLAQIEEDFWEKKE